MDSLRLIQSCSRHSRYGAWTLGASFVKRKMHPGNLISRKIRRLEARPRNSSITKTSVKISAVKPVTCFAVPTTKLFPDDRFSSKRTIRCNAFYRPKTAKWAMPFALKRSRPLFDPQCNLQALLWNFLNCVYIYLFIFLKKMYFCLCSRAP